MAQPAVSMRIPRDPTPSMEPGPVRAVPSMPGVPIADPTAPRWRVHDRTHLECVVTYPVADAGGGQQLSELEVYFFVPESFRLDSHTYRQDDIYADLQSYVRLATWPREAAELLDGPLHRLRQEASHGGKRAVDAARLGACLIRDNLNLAEQHIRGLDGAELVSEAEALLLVAPALSEKFRAEMHEPGGRDEDVIAHAWVRTEIALIVEGMLGRLARRLQLKKLSPELVTRLTQASVEQAKIRETGEFQLKLEDALAREQVEHFEFQRHVLKRFTSSVLWLSAIVVKPGRWLEHALYALAASAAMAFAVMAMLWNGPVATEGRWMMWLVVAVVAYAVKDRMKALLQESFRSAMSRHFPDRRWHVLTKDEESQLARVDAQSGFMAFAEVPEDVLGARRRTRLHSIEETARPETVLFHKKTFRIDGDAVRSTGADSSGLTEVLRLDLSRWLAHTDDPKATVVVADPRTCKIRRYKTPRVYNVAVVYRVRDPDGPGTPWKRLRVVVSRKGLRRIDYIG